MESGIGSVKCVVPNFGDRVKTEHGQDEEGKNVVSDFTTINVHTHAANFNKVSSLRAKNKT